MTIISSIFTVIHVIISILLVIVILLQSSKGGGLSGTFGGQASTALFGPRGTADILSKVTRYLAGSFLVLSLTLSLMAGAGSNPESVTQRVLESMPAMNLPAVDDIDFGSEAIPGSEVGTEAGGVQIESDDNASGETDTP